MKIPRQFPQVFREQVLDAIANLQTLTGKTVLALVGIMIGTGGRRRYAPHWIERPCGGHASI